MTPCDFWDTPALPKHMNESYVETKLRLGHQEIIRGLNSNAFPHTSRIISSIACEYSTIRSCSGKRVRSSNTNHNVVKNQSCPSRRVAYSILYRWRCSGNTKDVPWSCRTCKHIWLQSPSDQESDIGISNKAPVAGKVAFTLPSHNVRCRPKFHIFPSTRSKTVQCKPVKLSSNLSVARKEGKHVALQ